MIDFTPEELQILLDCLVYASCGDVCFRWDKSKENIFGVDKQRKLIEKFKGKFNVSKNVYAIESDDGFDDNPAHIRNLEANFGMMIKSKKRK